MKEIEKILCCVGFDKIFASVFQTAKFLSKEFRAFLYLLHVVEKIDISMAKVLGYEGKVEEFIKKEGKKREKEIMKFVEELKDEGINCEAVIRYGKPHKEIIESAEEFKPDIIMMGTYREDSIGSYFIGSTTWRVIESKKFPVLTIRKGITSLPEKILVPLDLSDLSFKAIDYAKIFKEKFNSKVFFTHVLVILESMSRWEAVEKIEKEIKKKMGEKIDVKGEIIVEKAPDASSGILKVAKDINADLIVMSTHGRGGIEKTLFGSVTERVIRESEIPVLSLPPI